MVKDQRSCLSTQDCRPVVIELLVDVHSIERKVSGPLHNLRSFMTRIKRVK